MKTTFANQGISGILMTHIVGPTRVYKRGDMGIYIILDSYILYIIDHSHCISLSVHKTFNKVYL